MKIMFFMFLIFSLILSLSSNNLFIMWISLEINMMSFIPLMINKLMYKMNSLMLMKYYMIQSIASMIFFISLIFMMMSTSFKYMTIMYYFMLMSMFMKMGIPPFLFWYINIMKKLKWANCIILSTIQKIIPMFILMKFMLFNNFILMIIMVSSSMSVLWGLKQSLLKLIMAYSSINHMSWMMLLILNSEKFLIKYFIIYSIISMKLMFLFNLLNLKSINNIFNLNNNKLIKLLILINMLSLGGLPPFMGFLLKWFSLKNMYMSNLKNFFLILILLINSTFTLLYYMNIFIPSMFMFNFKNKILNLTFKLKYILMYLMLFSSFYFLMLNNFMM